MNEAQLREEIRRLVNEQRQLNRRLQQQRVPTSVTATSSSDVVGSGTADDSSSSFCFSSLFGPPSSSGGGRGVNAGVNNGANSTYNNAGGKTRRRSHSPPEQQQRTLLQQQHRMAGSAEKFVSSSFSARGKFGSYSVSSSSAYAGNIRRLDDKNQDESIRVMGTGEGACSKPARALVAERLLAMGIPAGETSMGKRSLAPGERPVYDFQGPEFQVEKRPKLKMADEKTVTRDRRMFGALAGHLRRAQQQLQREQGTDWAHKHKQQEERVAQKLALSQKNIAEIARLEWEEKRQQERLRLEEVSMELVNKENELMRMHLVKHYKNMERFIGTEAQPTLFWLPAKWDEVTRRLQEQTRLWIQTKIDHIQSTDYTYRPQQSCNGTTAPAMEEEDNSATAEHRADSKMPETYSRAVRENPATAVFLTTTCATEAIANAVTPAALVSPSTRSSSSAYMVEEGAAANNHPGDSSARGPGKPVSNVLARGREPAAAEAASSGTVINTATLGDTEETPRQESGPCELEADAEGGADATGRSEGDCARQGGR